MRAHSASVVSLVSLPKDYKLSYMDLNRLKTHLNNLFPNTTLKRYALVIGASANLSLTTLIVKSPCLSDDFLTLIVAFIKRCFARTPYRFDDTLDNSVLDFIPNSRGQKTSISMVPSWECQRRKSMQSLTASSSSRASSNLLIHQ